MEICFFQFVASEEEQTPEGGSVLVTSVWEKRCRWKYEGTRGKVSTEFTVGDYICAHMRVTYIIHTHACHITMPEWGQACWSC